ncbi:MAG: aldo/keto reductase [Nitrososphaerota archaeon]
MNYRSFGKTGFNSSVIGMGTYYDPLWIFFANLGIRRGKDEKIQAIKTGLEEGINLIDTAELYKSENIVADAIKDYKRDEIFIATKVSSPNHFSYHGVIKACEASLRRLQTSYIDLYQIHFPFRFGRIAEIMRALEKLVDDGKIKYIGVSNFSLEQMIKAQECMTKYELASTQMHYNLMHRSIEDDIMPYCIKNRMAILAYYPLAHGRLARNSRVYEILEKYKGATPAQLALAWLTSRSQLVFPIPRASKSRHVAEDAKAGDLILEQADVEKLAILSKKA